MRADQIQARAVAKIVLVALFWAAVALLLAIALLHTRTTLQWVAAAIFLALALDPAVSLIQRAWPGDARMPRVLAILLVYLVALGGAGLPGPARLPADRSRHRGPRARSCPRYVHDFEDWANNNKQFQDLNAKYHITAKLSQEARHAAVAPEQRRQHHRLVHGEHPRAPAGGDHRDRPDLLPAARRPRHGRARHRPAARSRSVSAPAGSPTGSPRSSRPTSASTCCWRSRPACSPGGSSRQRAFTWPCRSRCWSPSST